MSDRCYFCNKEGAKGAVRLEPDSNTNTNFPACNACILSIKALILAAGSLTTRALATTYVQEGT